MFQILHITKTHKIVLAALFLTFSFFLFGSDARAASFTVDSTLDTADASLDATCDDGAGNCTLRAAIQEINDIGDSSNTITLPTGTILLGNNLPTINEPLTIQGQGMGETVIDGNNGNNQVIDADDVIGGIEIRDLTIRAFRYEAMGVISSNLTVQRVEIDGTGSLRAQSGINAFMIEDGIYTVTIEDVYIHNLTNTDTSTVGIILGSQGGSVLNATVDQVTVANIFDSSENGAVGIEAVTGFDGFQLTPGTVNAILRNITVSNISSTTSSSVGIASAGVVNGGTSNITMDVINATVTGINGVAGMLGDASSVVVGGAALGSDDSINSTVNLTNVLVDGSCVAETMSLGPPSAGTHNLAITSQGGNLSSSSTCQPYLIHSSDQNNVGNLASTLGTLSDNGGFVPTIPLLEGSPAIDSGVTVSGLTTDARLAVRPQGAAFDSGAYESPYTKTSEEESADSLAGTGENLTVMVAISFIAVILSTFVFLKSCFMLQ